MWRPNDAIHPLHFWEDKIAWRGFLVVCARWWTWHAACMQVTNPGMWRSTIGLRSMRMSCQHMPEHAQQMASTQLLHQQPGGELARLEASDSQRLQPVQWANAAVQPGPECQKAEQTEENRPRALKTIAHTRRPQGHQKHRATRTNSKRTRSTQCSMSD
jgi:hypothetical protein